MHRHSSFVEKERKVGRMNILSCDIHPDEKCNIIDN